MNRFPGWIAFISAHVLLFMPCFASASISSHTEEVSPQPGLWKSVQLAYGLPGAKPKDKGTLAMTPEALTFTGSTGSFTIPRGSVLAVSAGSHRVELWGMKGRMLRMVIPDGGGIAAAGVLHHRVDMLTVEFNDKTGGYHGAVFLLPAHDAERALQSFALTPEERPAAPPASCNSASPQRNSVLVAAPDWDQAEVPAAYRTLVYEHLIDRLEKSKGAGKVYRGGEHLGESGCPQFTIHLSITKFKEGSQVTRAAIGPLGMFVGTTQMAFDADFSDASGRLHQHQQIKATIRGESESLTVADKAAKSLAKQYASVRKTFDKPTAIQ